MVRMAPSTSCEWSVGVASMGHADEGGSGAMDDLHGAMKQLALEAAKAMFDASSAHCPGHDEDRWYSRNCPTCWAVAMLRFAARTHRSYVGDHDLDVYADELEGKP